MKQIAIIGGGISGLSAALTLQRAREQGAEVEYALFDSSPRLGGVLSTECVEGCLVEAGPDSFLTEKHWGLDFCRSLGLEDDLIASNDAERKTYILKRKQLVPIPDGLMFMVPTKLLPTALTPLFSWGTKVRMAREFLFPPSPNGTRDESVAQLVERHFGPEVVDCLAEPLLAGVYGGRANELSVRSVLPRFSEMEARYRSLSRGMLEARKRMAEMARTTGHKPKPLFTSLRHGMQQLVTAVQSRLDNAAVRGAMQVRGLQRSDAGWTLRLNEHQEKFDDVIVATPAWRAAEMLRETDSTLADDLATIPYSSSVTVTLGYRQQDLELLPPGFGFLVPRSEGRRMLACTFVHNKFPHRAPLDKGILRCFLGGAGDEQVLMLSNAEILDAVRGELLSILRLSAEPLFGRVYRWHRAMAQPGVGHADRVQRIESRAAEFGTLQLAGNAYHGIGVPDCIRSGEKAAAAALSALGINASPVPQPTHR
ncbi:MAG TPA: protoporphyrinogen oxidase [Terriglobales bacterium]|nr:protoporphyrinogen oxidase [Terriglobales bacterium]